MHKVRRMRTDYMHAEDLVRFSISNYFNYTCNLSHCMGLAERPELETSALYTNSFPRYLRFSQSDRSDFRRSENSCRHNRIVHLHNCSARIRSSDHAFLRCHMGEKHTSHHISDGINAFDIRLHSIINAYFATLPFLYAQCFQSDIFGVILPAYRNEKFLSCEFLAPGYKDMHAIKLFFNPFNPYPGQKFDLLLFQFAL